MDYSNATNLLQAVTFVCFLLIGNITVLLCLFIMYVSSYSNNRKYEFHNVIATLAFTNLCCGVNIGLLQPFFIVNGPISEILCQTVGYFLFCSVVWAMAFSPVLACSRYVALYNSVKYKVYFQRKPCVLYSLLTCAVSLIISVLLSNITFEDGFEYGWTIDTLVPEGVNTYNEFTSNSSGLNLSYTYICSINGKQRGWFFFFALLFICSLSMTSVGIIVLKIFTKIKEQRRLILRLNNAQRRRLQENSNLLALVILQGFAPIVLSFPYFSSIVIADIFNLNIYPTTALLTIPFFATCLSDSISTICMVKPYARAFQRLFRRAMCEEVHWYSVVNSREQYTPEQNTPATSGYTPSRNLSRHYNTLVQGTLTPLNSGTASSSRNSHRYSFRRNPGFSSSEEIEIHSTTL